MSETIQQKFRKNGFNYEVVERVGNIVMLSMAKNTRVLGYEVHILYITKPFSGLIMKKYPIKIEASESLQPTSEFGKKAWSYQSETWARKKFDELVKEAQNGEN